MAAAPVEPHQLEIAQRSFHSAAALLTAVQYSWSQLDTNIEQLRSKIQQCKSFWSDSLYAKG